MLPNVAEEGMTSAIRDDRNAAPSARKPQPVEQGSAPSPVNTHSKHMMNPYPFLEIDDSSEPRSGFEFTTATDSTSLLSDGVVAVPLIHVKLIRVSGEERKEFLHNLMSNDVKKLALGALQWNSLNSPKGRMIANMLLWQHDDATMLALSADVHGQVLKKLGMYVLRSKVRVEDASEAFSVIGVAGNGADDVLARAGLDRPAAPMSGAPSLAPSTLEITPDMFIVLAPAADASACWQRLLASGARAAGTAAWDLSQIRAGLPRISQPVQEEFVAQMVNFELIGGVSFNKGCYPGQEIVARTQYLGKLKKRMYRIRVDVAGEAGAGDDLFADEFGEQSIGKIVLAAPLPEGGWECLAVLQTASAEHGGVHFGTPDGPLVQVLPLPYSLG